MPEKRCYCYFQPSFLDKISIIENLFTRNLTKPKEEIIKNLSDLFNNHCMNCLERISEGEEKTRSVRKYKRDEICKFLNSKNFYHLVCSQCINSSK